MSLPTGETELRTLLAGLSPALAAAPRVLQVLPHDAPVPPGALLVFREAEGTTVITEADAAADAAGDAPRWAQVTLQVHSSLEAVGMMAAVSGALARAGIPCNVVSAYYHDHLFVPWARRNDALAALHTLAEATP